MLRTTVIAASLLLAGSAFAEEVIIRGDTPEPPPSTGRSTTVIEKHGLDCDSKTVHTENDAGDSKTVTKQECD